MYCTWKWPGVGLWTLLVLSAALAVPLWKAEAGKPKPPHPPPARVIAFFQLKSGGAHSTLSINTMDASGGNVLKVRQASDPELLKAHWSPDGLWLGGYGWFVQDEGVLDRAMFRIRADGSAEQEVVRYSDVDDFNVASDWKSLYRATPYPHYDGDLDGWASGPVWGPVMDLETDWGPEETMLFDATVLYTLQRWDPIQEKWVDYDCSVERIFGAGLQSGKVFQVTKEPAPYSDFAPDYSPACGKIVFVRNVDVGLEPRREELFLVNPDGSEVQQLTNFDLTREIICSAVWNRAGNALAVTIYDPEGDTDEFGKPIPIWTTWIVDLEGNPHWLRESRHNSEVAVAWSPDDSRLLINRSRRSGSAVWHQIVSVPISTGEETILKEVKDITTQGTDWSPVAPPQ